MDGDSRKTLYNTKLTLFDDKQKEFGLDSSNFEWKTIRIYTE